VIQDEDGIVTPTLDIDQACPPGFYRAVWISVLSQAYMDATTQNPKPEYQRAKVDAIKWLTKPSEDLYFVCDLAGCTPWDVMKRARELLFKGKDRANLPSFRSDGHPRKNK
jgi:hypothetical protein